MFSSLLACNLANGALAATAEHLDDGFYKIVFACCMESSFLRNVNKLQINTGFSYFSKCATLTLQSRYYTRCLWRRFDYLA